MNGWKKYFFVAKLIKITVVIFLFSDQCIAATCSGIQACGAGKYCHYSTQTQCKAGCYCPGGEKHATQNVPDITDRCKASSSYGDFAHVGGGAYKCPSTYPSSDAGTTGYTGCYLSCSSTKLYYQSSTISCSAGKYLPKASKSCSNCPAGKYCSGVSNKNPDCSSDQGIAGSCNGTKQYSGSGQSSCSTCSSGHYINSSHTTCSDCGKGYYCDGSVTRTKCTGAYYSSSDTASSCTQCTGDGKAVSTNSSGLNVDCKVCADGYYAGSNHSGCSICPAGSACKNGIKTACTGNKYAAVQATECSTCSGNGKGISGNDHTQCVTCPAGTYAEDGICKQCEIGYRCSGGADHYKCDASKGEYSDAKGLSQCKTCSGSTSYAVVDGELSKSCSSCLSADNYADKKQCLKCPSLPSNASSMAGYYKETSSVVNESITECRYGDKSQGCQNIFSGYSVIYKYNKGDTSKYVFDSDKKISAEKNYFVNGSSCRKCSEMNDGTTPYSIGGEIGSDSCYACGAGQCITGAGTANQDCKVCTAGFACPKKDGSAQQCNSDYKSAYGAYGVTICPKGSFSRARQASCTECAVGYTTAKVTDKCAKISNSEGLVSGGICCFKQSGGQEGCALPNASEDVIDTMCSEKGTSICYMKFSSNTFSCDPGFSWPKKGLKIGRPDMSVIKKQYSSNSKDDYSLNTAL